jgi:hypothetical protein
MRCQSRNPARDEQDSRNQQQVVRQEDETDVKQFHGFQLHTVDCQR